MSEDLTFDESSHEYRLAGRHVPSVTQVINSIAPQREVDDWYLQRGSAVHMTVALALQDKLDWSSVDERIKGRVDAILQFISDAKLSATHIESRVGSRFYQFAGTLDFVGKDPYGPMLADWKSSLCPQVEIQLGAYSLLRPVKRAVAVECRDNGTYKCKWLTEKDLVFASRTFLAFLTSHNWKIKNNLL